MTRPDGSVTSDPAQMSAVLGGHWGEVFNQTECKEDDVSRFVNKYSTQFPNVNWDLSEDQFLDMLGQTGNSAPGPDGIPYSCWRCAPRWIRSALYTCFSQWLDGRPLPTSFNYSFLALIPKTDAVAPAATDTRPLSLGNTDGKIFAMGIQRMFEQGLDKYISVEQAGFMPRSILRHVMDAEAQSMINSMRCPAGAACFFDFKAAFPSVCHKFLWEALKMAGIPERIIAAIRSLYRDNAHFLRWQMGRGPLFTVSSGVKQGCPLSPTLFIVAGEAILNCLKAHLSKADMVRCYADDIAWITTALWRAGPAFAAAFLDVATCTGLRLNPKKCVCVPLWQYSKDSVRHLLQELIPGWRNFQIANKAKYLGVWLGPGAADTCWRDADAKFSQRVEIIASLGLGSFRSALAYRTFAATVFGYLMQVLPLRDDWGQIESTAFGTIVKGPTAWLPAAWWSRPQSIVPLPSQFLHLETYHKASLLRTALRTLSDYTKWCLQYEEASGGDGAPLRHRWADWHSRSIAMTLQAAWSAHGSATLRELRSEDRLQAKIYTTILQPIAVAEAVRVWDRRLRRWSVLTQPPVSCRKLRQRCYEGMCIIAKAPPSTRWALARAWLNGWCTARRFQTRQACPFCGGGEDSIEHFCRCRVIREVGNSRLALGLDPADPLGLLLLDGRFRTRHATLRHALFLHAVYKAHNALRRADSDRSAFETIWTHVRGIALQHRELSGLV